MLASKFTEAFRDEHRRMRDALLALTEAFAADDGASIRDIIAAMAADAGPHFSYEREALYPALANFYGEDYLNELLAEHDAALEATRELAELAQADELDSEASERGLELVRQLLPHVSDREGLSIMVEVLPTGHVERIMEAREESRRAVKKVAKVPVTQRKGKVTKPKAKAGAPKAAKTRKMLKKPRKAAATSRRAR